MSWLLCSNFSVEWSRGQWIFSFYKHEFVLLSLVIRLLRCLCNFHGKYRYVQAPLAYPRERKRRMNGGENWLPFCIYSNGRFANKVTPCYWSDYYAANPRSPHITQLAPWVAKFYKRKWKNSLCLNPILVTVLLAIIFLVHTFFLQHRDIHFDIKNTFWWYRDHYKNRLVEGPKQMNILKLLE